MTSDDLLEIVNRYRLAHGDLEATAEEIGAWAVEKKLYTVDSQRATGMAARELQSAMTHKTIEMEDGAKVRKYHAAPKQRVSLSGKTETVFLWRDFNDASHAHMLTSFEHRRGQAYARWEQLQVDVGAYNKYRKPKRRRPIRMLWEFDAGDRGEETA